MVSKQRQDYSRTSKFEASEPEKERALYYKQEKQTKLSAVLKKINVVVSEER